MATVAWKDSRIVSHYWLRLVRVNLPEVRDGLGVVAVFDGV
ncbi:hypothetical protein BX265_8263 [Streptomyces sp. TLI_235]|nr:hypothetical protein BX265_8263 [Streptomyces sp. TLI_235]